MEEAPSRYSINFDPEGIAIYHDDNEVLYWHKQEWIDEPEVVFSIAYAIRLALVEPDRLGEAIGNISRTRKRLEALHWRAV
jgi:hypothetical protein